jgi:lambda family phage portal protein
MINPFKTRQQIPIKNRKGLSGMVRGFAAAQTDRLLSGWRYDGGFTPSEIATHLETIRSRSRQMAKDSAHFKRWLDLCKINIVGPDGFALKSTPHDRRPNGELTLDESAARFIEYHWWRFCNHRDRKTKQTMFDATGRKTAAQMDRLNVETWKRDGEYFIQILRTDRNPYGITFRVLRPDWCDHKLNQADTGRGTLIHCGVEMDIDSRYPVAYWFHTAPTNPYADKSYGTPRIRIPASEIIHGFTQHDEDQPRGIPESYAVLRKLAMLDQFDLAELTAARDEACTVRTYEAQDGADPDGFVDLTDDENADAARALTLEKEPGQSEILPRGYKMQVHTPQHPNREVVPFKQGMLKDLASGFGVEYSNWANDWTGVSFSSVRVGTISERDHWITEQNQMIEQCKTPQFLAWLESFLELAISGNFPMEKFEKFAEHEWRGRRWMWVDPTKDMNAAKMAVDNGWKTNTDVASDLGNDYQDNLETMQREKNAQDKYGFVPVMKAGTALPGKSDPKKDEEDDDDEE